MKRVIILDKFIEADLPLEKKWEYIKALLKEPKPVDSFRDTLGVYSEEHKEPYKYIDLDPEKSHKILHAYNEIIRVLFTKKNEICHLPTETHTQHNYKDITSLINFLDAHKVEDYYLYFYTLFAATNWGAVWSLRRCYTANALNLYVSWKDRYKAEIEKDKAMLVNQLEEQTAKTTGAKPNQWVNIYPHIEDVKKRFLNRDQSHICNGRLGEFLGFHPKSEACNSCPLKGKCSADIYKHFQSVSNSDLDILDIRAGNLSLESATRKLRSEGNGFDFYS